MSLLNNWKGFCLLLALLVLSACSPTRALNAVVPSGSYTFYQDQVYGSHERQQMDIYVPTEADVKPDVMVFVYGGAWDEGDKKDFAFIEDIALALAQLPQTLEEIENRCVSGRKIILSGHSAGAHTVDLLAADTQYLNNVGVDYSQLVALIGLSGPYDLPLEHPRVGEKFSRVTGNQTNPIELAHADIPATLLIHGESDTVAKPAHTRRFAERLTELGVHAELQTYPRRRHVDIVASLASPLRFWSSTYDDIQRFLQHIEINKAGFKQPEPCESGIKEHN